MKAEISLIIRVQILCTEQIVNLHTRLIHNCGCQTVDKRG
jgi:hypothetical protein